MDFTTGMHRVVIFGAVLSIIMAFLSLIGFNKDGTIIEDAEKAVKKRRKHLQRRVAKQVHQVAVVFNRT